MCRRATTRENVLGLRDLVWRRLAQEVADDLPIRRSIGGRNQIFDVGAHRVRNATQQHDRDVALAALELRDVAFGNAGHPGEHLPRHAAKGAHGADTLAELFEKLFFGIGLFVHFHRWIFAVEVET